MPCIGETLEDVAEKEGKNPIRKLGLAYGSFGVLSLMGWYIYREKNASSACQLTIWC
jgi:hypothetical protein